MILILAGLSAGLLWTSLHSVLFFAPARDLDDKTVMDFGKAAEVFCYRLHAAPDGHVYGMTRSGFLFRVNTTGTDPALWQTVLLPQIMVSLLAFPLFYLGAWAISRIAR